MNAAACCLRLGLLAAFVAGLLFVDQATAIHTQDVQEVGAISCEKCKLVVKVIVDVVNNSALFPQIIAAADGECTRRFANSTEDESICKAVVAIAAKALPAAVRGLESLAWNIPVTVCADLVKACTVPCCKDATTPEQFLLSFPSDVADFADGAMSMRVTWVTRTLTPGAAVHVWPTRANCLPTMPGCGARFSEAPTRTYTEGGWIGIIHMADMLGLNAATNYSYQLFVNDAPASPVFGFSTLPANIGSEARPLRMATIADIDFGPAGANTVRRLIELADAGAVDVLVISGDVSYADGEESHWDIFMNEIQPIASRIPVLTAPGNHEIWWNFTSYKQRLARSMPAAGGGAPADAMYYAVRIGSAQLLVLDSESPIDTADIDTVQQGWLQGQLQRINADRSATPWVLAFQHRPLYCTNHNKLQCQTFAFLLRLQVEQLFASGKVDVAFAGHLHGWERSFPVLGGSVTSSNYTNPSSPVYIVNGAAGNREGNSMPAGGEPWSAFRSREVGYSTYVLSSNSAAEHHWLDITFFSSLTNEVVDAVTIEKSTT